MNRVVIGLLMGVGVVSGLAVLLLRGEKTQRFLRERWQQLRRALPEPEHVQQSAQQVADRLSQATSEVKDTAQQALKKSLLKPVNRESREVRIRNEICFTNGASSIGDASRTTCEEDNPSSSYSTTITACMS